MSAPLTITFAQAKAANACDQSYRKMARHLGGITKYGADTPVPIETILDVCGMKDATWALSAIRDTRTPRLWACDCAERVLPIFESDRPGDLRPRDAIRASRRYARGEIGAAAEAVAWAAAGDAAWYAARSAAWAAAGAAARVSCSRRSSFAASVLTMPPRRLPLYRQRREHTTERRAAKIEPLAAARECPVEAISIVDSETGEIVGTGRAQRD